MAMRLLRTNRVAALLTLGITVVVLLAGAASIRHSHESRTSLLSNEDCGLTLLAALGATCGLVPDAPVSAPCTIVVYVVASGVAAVAPHAAPRDQDSRAPPLSPA
jgi:hypothetical protein